MSVQAVAKSVRISPRKANLVAALVRGRSVEDALIILEHTPKKAALSISKVVTSAKANAVHNHNYKEQSLVILELSIGPGVAMKRLRPVAFGRGHQYKHRTSHIRVVVNGDQRPQETKKPVKGKSIAKTTAKKVTADVKENK